MVDDLIKLDRPLASLGRRCRFPIIVQQEELGTAMA
jgi:hypothetical protein